MAEDNAIIEPGTKLEDLSVERLQKLELQVASASILLDRMRFAQQNGITFGGKRDEYDILGYDRVITNKMYRDEYARGGIAGRIIDAFPDATWRGKFEVFEDEDPEVETPFEKAWIELEKKHSLVNKFYRADKLARLSSYSCILIGARGGGSDLSTELPKGNGTPAGLLYFQPYMGGGGPGLDAREGITSAFDASITIQEYDLNAQSERFGLPQFYQLRTIGVTRAEDQGGRKVHWSRVIHVAEGLLENDVFGQPALERVWNLLIDLRKVTGGGAEAFWLRANQGLQLDIDKDMTFGPPGPDGKTELDKLKEQAEEYQHNIRRILRTKGVTATPLGSDVANFSQSADAIITQIAGARGIPKRILTGSEMGELASAQDRDNWKDQIDGRQVGYCSPIIVKQTVDRLLKYNYMPPPKEGIDSYQIVWPEQETLTETEKADGAGKWASVNQTQGDIIFTDAEIRDKWYSMPPLTDEQRAEIQRQKAEKLKEQQELMKTKSSLFPNPFAKQKEKEQEDEEEDVEERAAVSARLLVETLRPKKPQSKGTRTPGKRLLSWLGTAWRQGARAQASPTPKVLREGQKGHAKEGPIHELADKYSSDIQALFEAAFKVARKALGTGKQPKVDAAIGALRRYLRVRLSRLLLEIVDDGGELTAQNLEGLEFRITADKKSFSFSRTNQPAVDWADMHAAELISGISEVTRESINNAIAEALENGTIDEAYDEILAAIGDTERAALIARHETMTAVSEGQRQAWNQAVEEGYLSGEEKRVWITVGDENVCPFCEELDGQITDLNGTYGDGIPGPPGHVLCRCTEGIVK